MPETHAAIGDLPRGRGILGVLIREAEPLRLHDLGDDPRSVGFPANHPPMASFLGVPILLRGVAYGNLYLTEKEGGGDFTDEDEELTQLLAAQAAVAIENTRLYETSTRWLRHLESLNEIGDALAGELELEPLLGLVARRLRGLIEARLVLIALPEAGAGRPPRRGGGRGRLRCVRARRDGARARRLEDGTRPAAGAERASRLGARRPGDRSAGRAPHGRSISAVRSAGRTRTADRRRRRTRQARRDVELLRRGRPTHGVARGARRDRGRSLRAGESRCRSPRRRGSGGRARPAGARAPRRDRSGAHVDPARTEVARGPRRQRAPGTSP